MLSRGGTYIVIYIMYTNKWCSQYTLLHKLEGVPEARVAFTLGPHIAKDAPP